MADKTVDQLVAELSANAEKLREALEGIPSSAFPDKDQREIVNRTLAASKAAMKAMDEFNRNKSKFTPDVIALIQGKGKH